MYFDDLVEKYHRENREQEMFHDLMRYRVHEILLVASLYNSFVIKQDGALSEQIYGEFFSLNLTTIPRITCAYTYESAREMFSQTKFDMVILMAGLEFDQALDLAKDMKSKNPSAPILFLAMNNTSLRGLDQNGAENKEIFDRIFVWNGYSKLFVGMIKYIEDLHNVESDTQTGLVRVILLVEDSIRYYSRYLPLLYSVVMNQTKILVEEERSVETNKIIRMRWRPKILLATNFEDACSLFKRYEPYLLTVISDIRYPVNGVDDSEAGFKFLERIKAKRPETPVLLQSSEAKNRSRAYKMGAAFADKNTNTIGIELIDFFQTHLGFGPFVFKTPDGKELSRANNMDEFEAQMRIIPNDCLLYHGDNNHFSTWLIARGEMSVARIIRNYCSADFETPEQVRNFLLGSLYKIRKARARGSIPMLDVHGSPSKVPEPAIFELPAHNMVRLGSGSVGGKGRGLVFIGSLIENFAFSNMHEKMEIQLPYTAIIGIDEFENFMERSELWDFSWFSRSDDEIKKLFLSFPLDGSLVERLRMFLGTTNKPLAIRSSGLFEDMLMVPFSGVYDTYVISNSSHDYEIRLNELCDAIRLVYASLYLESTREYFDTAFYKIEEERMAVIIQELVGTRQDNWFYPIISGIAQSYNYYPFSYLKPDDGLCIAAIGLGCHVVDGGAAFRFSPRYPKLDISVSGSQISGTQRSFYALDMTRGSCNLLSSSNTTLECLDISAAEKNPDFAITASTYNREDDRLEPGINSPGLKVINFAPILKSELFPFAEVLEAVLDVSSKSMGFPVEIEFAVSRQDNKPVFYFLQLKPLIQNTSRIETTLEKYDTKDCFIVSGRSMGNGRDDTISDIIWVYPETFSGAHTGEIAGEIGDLNSMLKSSGRRYVLVGPGRWGTRDFSLGIPVNFPQISSSRIIVETDLPNFKVESSQGSHFFHNVISMNIGYLSVSSSRANDFIDWEWLKSLHCEKKMQFCRWSKTSEPLNIIMDGRSGNTLILKR